MQYQLTVDGNITVEFTPEEFSQHVILPNEAMAKWIDAYPSGAGAKEILMGDKTLWDVISGQYSTQLAMSATIKSHLGV